MRRFFHFSRPKSWRLLGLSLIVMALWLVLPNGRAEAHPLGNFSVNRYSRLELNEANQLTIVYVLDMAEIPTFQLWPEIDRNGNDEIEASEQVAYEAHLAETIGQQLNLSVNGRLVDITQQTASLTFPPGQGDLPTMRLEAAYTAALPAAQTWQIDYADNNYADRLGWQEIVFSPTAAAELVSSDSLTTDLSQGLTNYPTDLLQSPPSVRNVTLTLQAAGSPSQPTTATAVTTPAAERNRFSSDHFADLIAIPQLTPTILIITLLTAFGLGAAHALTPGHGKTIVGAYLVGSRGTAKHAIFLGLTTTVTHTAGVFLFGLLVLFASQFILPEQLYPWLGVFSGLLVVTIGGSMLWERWHSRQTAVASAQHEEGYHTHFGISHSHTPTAANSKITWRSLLALGISGGLLPCPSALVVLLSAIALQRVAFGLVLIVVFSIGLASVLTAIGLTLVYASRFFERFSFGNGRLATILPIASAAFITLAGFGITFQAIANIGLL